MIVNSVKVPHRRGGFGEPVDGGGDDPKKPSSSQLGRSHYAESSALSTSKNSEKKRRKKANKRRCRTEEEADAAPFDKKMEDETVPPRSELASSEHEDSEPESVENEKL
ncbi:hypothetical protein IMSHALPRED_004689 [Imshaugia aleurites]|uniref:Uncharacterized protein n=1 Tax=Imshaugia aleurites TaxID=172621 RepID=A0A8H3IN08_9LECA|nr:hypothetical protein IMSHALPRED_004689 [Imshaugia aleurites]